MAEVVAAKEWVGKEGIEDPIVLVGAVTPNCIGGFDNAIPGSVIGGVYFSAVEEVGTDQAVLFTVEGWEENGKFWT
jgi:hypothetical protein